MERQRLGDQQLRALAAPDDPDPGHRFVLGRRQISVDVPAQFIKWVDVVLEARHDRIAVAKINDIHGPLGNPPGQFPRHLSNRILVEFDIAGLPSLSESSSIIINMYRYRAYSCRARRCHRVSVSSLAELNAVRQVPLFCGLYCPRRRDARSSCSPTAPFVDSIFIGLIHDIVRRRRRGRCRTGGSSPFVRPATSSGRQHLGDLRPQCSRRSCRLLQPETQQINNVQRAWGKASCLPACRSSYVGSTGGVGRS